MAQEKAGRRVIKKIGRSHVVWFPESNRWIEFREPAWFIYTRYRRGEEAGSIADELSARYGLPVHEARRFLGEIMAGIKDTTRISAQPVSFYS